MHYRFGINIEESIYIRVYSQRLQGNYGSYWAVAASVGEVILQSLDHGNIIRSWLHHSTDFTATCNFEMMIVLSKELVM